jgi:dCMP deaminase
MQDGHDISTIHAEQNAICNAAKNGISLKGCSAFVTHSPCQACTKLLIMCGIEKVFYLEPYRMEENPFKHKIPMEEIK